MRLYLWNAHKHTQKSKIVESGSKSAPHTFKRVAASGDTFKSVRRTFWGRLYYFTFLCVFVYIPVVLPEYYMCISILCVYTMCCMRLYLCNAMCFYTFETNAYILGQSALASLVFFLSFLCILRMKIHILHILVTYYLCVHKY